MLIQWRASSQWEVPRFSPSSGCAPRTSRNVAPERAAVCKNSVFGCVTNIANLAMIQVAETWRENVDRHAADWTRTWDRRQAADPGHRTLEPARDSLADLH